MDKTIKKIRWNGRVMDVTHVGDKTGTKFFCNEAKVEEFGRNRVNKIIEESLTVYSIFYSNGDVLRIFNPIDVLYVKRMDYQNIEALQRI